MAKFKFDEDHESKPDPKTKGSAPDIFSKLSEKQDSESATDNLLNNIKPFSFDEFMKSSTTAPRQPNPPVTPPPIPTTTPPRPPAKPRPVEDEAAEWINTNAPIPPSIPELIRNAAGATGPEARYPVQDRILSDLARARNSKKPPSLIDKLSKAVNEVFEQIKHPQDEGMHRLLQNCSRCGASSFSYGRLGFGSQFGFSEIKFQEEQTNRMRRILYQRCRRCGLVQMTTGIRSTSAPDPEIDGDLFE